MFRGQFQHSLDQKGRIALPARFREGLTASKGGACILTPSPFDLCLRLYPLSAWEKVEEKIGELHSMNPHAVRLRRLFVSAAHDCELDRSGRLLVPASLREKVGLEREALWAGMGDHLELWAVARWQAALELDPDQETEFRRAVLEEFKI